MAESIDSLFDEALENLRKFRKQPNLMTRPVEGWSVPRYLDTLNFMIKSIEPINEALRRMGGESHPAHEALQHSERFYNQLLQQGHMTIGFVIRALRKHEVPEAVVMAACVNAYLFPEVREAIKEGYGLVPLVEPEPKKPPQSA